MILVGLLPALATAGTWIAANAGTLATVAGTAASVGTSIYGAAQKPPKMPTSLDDRRSLLAQRLASGRTKRGEQGLATGGSLLGDLTSAPVGKRTLLGG